MAEINVLTIKINQLLFKGNFSGDFPKIFQVVQYMGTVQEQEIRNGQVRNPILRQTRSVKLSITRTFRRPTFFREASIIDSFLILSLFTCRAFIFLFQLIITTLTTVVALKLSRNPQTPKIGYEYCLGLICQYPLKSLFSDRMQV